MKKGVFGKEMVFIDEVILVLIGICILNFDGMLGFVVIDWYRVYKYVFNVEVIEE